ncbi:GNAT family N-acetyltransferase [Microbacterium sp. CIAB417]|uniref:GNAT family N-acetyltransferase n=1 Tax=Microbacterium sp. CIAB417 TaxID=2860287 RepID=UPI001FABFC29|nr:GNAT family N-acetyltransferase [Microbacterium sp. CIAB417]
MLSDAALDAMDTERLLLRRQHESDAAVFRQLWTERDERVPPHRRIAPSGHPTVDDIVRQIRDRGSGPGPGLLTMERRETSAVIGYCGLVVAGKGNPEEPELAFEILRAEHNRGYATEAGAAVLGWARQAGYHRIRASVWDWNAASLRVLEKLGFEDSGVVVGESVHGRSLMMVRRL